jgi:putative aldouronate transport system permease protein
MASVGAKKRFSLFDLINGTLLLLFSISVIYPVLYLLFVSLSSREGMAMFDSVLMLWPQGFNLGAYKTVFKESFVYTGYTYTIGRTLIGTCLSVFLMCLAAYGLAKGIPFRKSLTFYFVFTMFFTGGLIPTYLLMKELGLLDNPLVYIVAPPFLYNTFNMLILRNFFMTIPDSLEESARMDGAGDLRIFFNIIIPLSAPAIATISLWMAVSHWNAWFDSLMYIQSQDKQVIQILVRKLVIEQNASVISSISDASDPRLPAAESIRSAAILVAMLPILCVYPFIQKFFVKGVVMGAVKG